MAKQIIDDTVMENVEILAKLALTEEERKKAKEKMQEMIIGGPDRMRGAAGAIGGKHGRKI